MPRVSVIMPAYNSEKYIAEAIESVLKQTYSDFEFIIIDDGSIDSTADIIQKYADNRIRFLKNETNAGIVYTLNKGIAAAHGEYIIRMDSDDISLPERFQKQVSYMDLHPELAVCGANMVFFGDVQGKTDMPVGTAWCKANSFFMTPMPHPVVIIRKSVLEKYKLKYDPDYERIEDFDLWTRICEFGLIDNMSDVLLKYRVHKKQLTQNHTSEEIDRWYKLKQREIKRLRMTYTEAEFRAYIMYCFQFKQMDFDNVLCLELFLKRAYEANRYWRYYDETALRNVMANCIWFCHNELSLAKKQKKIILANAFCISKWDAFKRHFKMGVGHVLRKFFQ